MAFALAAAIAGDVLKHLWVPRSEFVDLLDLRHRSRWLERDPRQRGQRSNVRLHRGYGSNLGSGWTRPQVGLRALAGGDKYY